MQCECDRLPELLTQLQRLREFSQEQARLISQMINHEQPIFSGDFMTVLDGLMQAYGQVQKQILVLHSKTESLLQFQQEQQRLQDAEQHQQSVTMS